MLKHGPRGRVREYHRQDGKYHHNLCLFTRLGHERVTRSHRSKGRPPKQRSKGVSATSESDARRRNLSSLVVKDGNARPGLTGFNVSGRKTRNEETKTYRVPKLSIGLQFLATSKDSYDPTWLRNHIHHGFHGGRTFHKTFPATKDRRGSTVPVFTVGMVRYVFLVPERAIGIFVFPIAMRILR